MEFAASRFANADARHAHRMVTDDVHPVMQPDCNRPTKRGGQAKGRKLQLEPQAPSLLQCADFEIGAGKEIRTLDPNLGKVVLYH